MFQHISEYYQQYDAPSIHLFLKYCVLNCDSYERIDLIPFVYNTVVHLLPAVIDDLSVGACLRVLRTVVRFNLITEEATDVAVRVVDRLLLLATQSGDSAGVFKGMLLLKHEVAEKLGEDRQKKLVRLALEHVPETQMEH